MKPTESVKLEGSRYSILIGPPQGIAPAPLVRKTFNDEEFMESKTASRLLMEPQKRQIKPVTKLEKGLFVSAIPDGQRF